MVQKRIGSRPDGSGSDGIKPDGGGSDGRIPKVVKMGEVQMEEVRMEVVALLFQSLAKILSFSFSFGRKSVESSLPVSLDR